MHLSETLPRQEKPGAHKRSRLNKRIPRMGRVVFSDHDNAVHCTVKSFSDKGAILTMSGWLGLPSNFELYVEPDNIRASCSVSKRKGSNIEVAFTDVETDVRYRARA
ncbi:MAG: PilZ domain-containing protein [Rhizobiaceae bacterium]|jgi:hypothetical protein|nr:PilZ domain-containing protein [Rhizobiaceae bacterium]